MGGFFLICTGPNEDRSDEISRLQKAFADLGFPLPEIVKEEGYLFAAYPKFQRRSAALERDPNGDFSFVCGTCLCEGGGLADVTALPRYYAEFVHEQTDHGSLCRGLKKKSRTQIK